MSTDGGAETKVVQTEKKYAQRYSDTRSIYRQVDVNSIGC